MEAAQKVLHLVVGDDAALLQVDQQHLARLQAPLADDPLFRDRQHAGLRRHDHQTIVGDDVAGRAQAVAVERGADLAAVGESDRGRAVPRLHHRGVVLVEGAAALIHQRVAGPRLGDEDHHRVGQRVAALHEELQGVVEAGGVGLPLVGDRPQLADVLAEQVGGHRGLARRHPVHVAAQRVDLTIVGDVAVGMGELPGREGVGGEALVDEGERGRQGGVAQVLEVVAELSGEQQSLVDDGARGHRHHVEAGEALVPAGEDRVGDRLAQHVEAALENLVVGVGLAAPDEQLPCRRLAAQHALAEHRGVHRHVAPAEQREALLGAETGDDGLDLGTRGPILGQEHDADRVAAALGQRETVLARLRGEELVRDLQEHAATIARLRVGPGGASMVEVEEDLQPHAHQVVRLPVVHVGDEADAAGIMLLGGVVEALGVRQPGDGPDVATHAGVERRSGDRRRQDPATRLVGVQPIRGPIVCRHGVPRVKKSGPGRADRAIKVGHVWKLNRPGDRSGANSAGAEPAGAQIIARPPPADPAR